MLAAILTSINPGIVKRNQRAVDPNRGTSDVVIPGCHIISKVDNITNAWARRNPPVSVSEVGDRISLTGIQKDKMNFYIGSLTLDM